MIDTIKFKIMVDPKKLEKVKSNCVASRKYQTKTEEIYFEFYFKDIRVGSFEKSVSIMLNNKDHIFIEVSLPKIAIGNNIFLIDKKGWSKALDQLRKELVDQFGNIPKISQWELYKIDLCYAWKLYSQEDLDIALDYLRTKTPRGSRLYSYKSSIMQLGSHKVIKFYDKGKEFYKHDFKEIRKHDLDRAYNLLHMSNYVLRFEVSLKKRYLDYYRLEKNIELWNDDKITEILKNELEKFLVINGNITEKQDVLMALLEKYQTTKAIRLYNFWKNYNSKQTFEKSITKMLKKSQHYKNIREIQSLGIGISKTLKFMTIPSESSVGVGYSNTQQ